jgi:hypothetical protein
MCDNAHTSAFQHDILDMLDTTFFDYTLNIIATTAGNKKAFYTLFDILKLTLYIGKQILWLLLKHAHRANKSIH